MSRRILKIHVVKDSNEHLELRKINVASDGNQHLELKKINVIGNTSGEIEVKVAIHGINNVYKELYEAEAKSIDAAMKTLAKRNKVEIEAKYKRLLENE